MVEAKDIAYRRRYCISGNRRLRTRPGAGIINVGSARKRRRRRGWGRDATAGVLYTRQLPIFQFISPLIIISITPLTNWQAVITDKDIIMAMPLVAGNFFGVYCFRTFIGKVNGDSYIVLASLRATPVTARRATRAVRLANPFCRITRIIPSTLGAD